MMIDELCNNLDRLMTAESLSASELARRVNLPASTIKKIRNHDSPNPTLLTLLPLANYFSLTLSELIGERPSEQDGKNKSYSIPILSWEGAMTWPEFKSTETHTIRVEQNYGKDSFALQVAEEDWEHFKKGTVLIIDPTLKPLHRDYVVTHKKGQHIPSLRQICMDEDSIYLKPLTAGYNITLLTPEHRVLGVVVEYRKQTR